MSPGSGNELPRRAADALLARGWSLALAESCTGGLVSKLLTDVPGSSRYLKGGVVAYSNRSKIDVLGVEEASITAHGAVSGEVAVEMAVGVTRVFESEVGLAVTGIAGPDGGVPGKPVGTVWFSVSAPTGVLTEPIRFPGDRGEVRDAAARHAVKLLLRIASPP